MASKITKKTSATLHLMNKSWIVSPKIKDKGKVPTLSISLQHWTGSSHKWNKARNDVKKKKNYSWKGKTQTLFRVNYNIQRKT